MVKNTTLSQLPLLNVWKSPYLLYKLFIDKQGPKIYHRIN